MSGVLLLAPGASRPKLPMRMRAEVILGLLVLAITFGGFGTWAAVAPLASAVIATGFVTVDSNRQAVQHLEGGIVAELLVRNGDLVDAGQVLIRLDDTRARASLGILMAGYDAARALEARLVAERSGATEIVFSADLLGRAGTTNVDEILDGERLLFEARRNSLAGQALVLEQRIAQLHEQIVGLQAESASKEQQIALINDELRGVRDLFQKGYVEKPRLLALEREAARLGGERGRHVADIARTRTAIGEAELEMLQLEKSFRESVAAELREVQTRIFDLEERIAAARHVLDHVEVRAPRRGTVVGMGVHTVGGVIRAGETVLEIVPIEDQLLVEAQVLPQDIDNVVLGQAADVHFSAFRQRTTPTLAGQVVYVSADKLVEQRTGLSYYSVRVAVSDQEVAKLGDRRLHPGMPAEVMIKTGERTAAQYLLQPILDSMNRAWREQ